MSHKLLPRRLLMFSSSVITAGFFLHHRAGREKSAYSPTTSPRDRSSIYSICSLQGVLTSKHLTLTDCWFFPLISGLSLLSAILPFPFTLAVYVSCYFKQQPTSNMNTHALATWQYGRVWHKLLPRWCRGETLSHQCSHTGVNTAGSVHRWGNMCLSEPMSHRLLIFFGSVKPRLCSVSIIGVKGRTPQSPIQHFSFTLFSELSEVSWHTTELWMIRWSAGL